MNKVNVCIVGLGLMGGSLALSLKKVYPEWTVIGYDHNKKHIKQAVDLKLVDKIAKDFDEVKKSNIIILAIPVEAIIKALQNMEDISQDTIIIDLGSTKEKIVKNTPKKIRKNLVAAHPMTGTENTGPTAAFETLYDNKVVVLCDLEDSGEKQKNITINLFKKLNMKIFYMDSVSHDYHAAYISHLPHAMSFSLANTVLNQENPKSILAMAGGGFSSMARIAKSSPIMWSDIFKQNKKNLLNSIDSFNKEVNLLKNMIEEERWEELQLWMKKANSIHDII